MKIGKCADKNEIIMRFTKVEDDGRIRTFTYAFWDAENFDEAMGLLVDTPRIKHPYCRYYTECRDSKDLDKKMKESDKVLRRRRNHGLKGL